MATLTVKGAQKDLASFQASAKKQLAELSQKIEQLKNKAKDGTDAKAKQTADSLEKSRIELEHKLQEMKETSQNNVKSLKEQIGDSLNRLNSKVQSALRD